MPAASARGVPFLRWDISNPLLVDRERRRVDSRNKCQVNGHDVNRQSREDEERSDPHAPITMRSLPVRNRIVMV
jgi:hypothetical protein